ncbi:MAG: Gfo/Idh/MocA family oxidoreductase [Candidatus Hydrogenedentes bacterium]|nr:Gfo/Idh/MocA family oxidoreductase [Candidatus Hydrogenedentota bacterium]
MTEITRRNFMQTAGAGALMSAAALSSARSYAANGRVGHAVIGTGGQGRNHARGFAGLEDCDLVMICDVDPKRREQALAELPHPDKTKAVDHYEEVLNNPDVHSVSVTTPDHWHTPLALLALKAGKHVYVEKPCCHNIHEGMVLDRSAKAAGKCVQHGTQSRSGPGIIDAFNWLKEGHLGKIRVAKAINHQFREPIGRKPVSDPPPGVNYDLWLGPAPQHPFTMNRWHYNWHWIWDYGCGDIGNDGIHQVDVARWGLGVGYPNRVDGPGTQLFYDDDHETPDSQMVTYQYDDCWLIYEMRLWTPYPLEGHDNGVVFYGDKGRLEVGRKGSIAYFLEGEPKVIGGSHDFTANIKNFIACVQANDPSKLNAPISEGVISANLCHLGNIATRVGRPLRFDAGQMVCVEDDEATALLKRTYREGFQLAEVG